MEDLLAQDHAEVDALLRDLSHAFGRGAAREVFERLDWLWARLAVHIRAEHLHLFPALTAAAAAAREAAAGAPTAEEVRAAVGRLREDHDFFMRELAGAAGAARELAAGAGRADPERLRQVEGSVVALAERLAEHNRFEERCVYLWPEALLSAAQLEALRAATRREIENLPPRFSGGRGR